MMVGIVVSNSILIVEFTNRLRAEGRSLREAVSLACRVRLRPQRMNLAEGQRQGLDHQAIDPQPPGVRRGQPCRHRMIRQRLTSLRLWHP